MTSRQAPGIRHQASVKGEGNVLSFSKHGNEWSLQEKVHPNVVRMASAYSKSQNSKAARVSLYA